MRKKMGLGSLHIIDGSIRKGKTSGKLRYKNADFGSMNLLLGRALAFISGI